MNFTEKVLELSRRKNSFVCVGLDTELAKIPPFLKKYEDPLFEFNKAIINATQDFVVAYKPNLAFYEARGASGLMTLEKTLKYIPEDAIAIGDAKRGDIGNTARMYATALFDHFQFDAVTLNPYLGHDSLTPFLQFAEKGVFVLCLTSNPGSQDFQYFSSSHQKLYQRVAEKVNNWNEKHNCGLVVGATHPEELKEIRDLCPDLPFLIPGIGAQGGDLELSIKYGADKNGELAIFNSSRGIIYQSSQADFAEAAGKAAANLRDVINSIRTQLSAKFGSSFH